MQAHFQVYASDGQLREQLTVLQVAAARYLAIAMQILSNYDARHLASDGLAFFASPRLPFKPFLSVLVNCHLQIPRNLARELTQRRA
jgi:hypothetical protein